MNTGNKHQSEWSAEFHAARGAVNVQCPAVEFGGHEGDCMTAHPHGITILPQGGWKPGAAGDGWTQPFIESYV